MKCQRLMLRLALFVLLNLSAAAMAGITIGNQLNQTSASNVIQATGAPAPTFYYSNITSVGPVGGSYVGAAGGACSPTLNPRCINNSAASNGFNGFTLQAADSVATSGLPQFYLLYSSTGVAPTANGTAIATQATSLINWSYGSANSLVQSTPVSWSYLCSQIAASNTAIDSNCQQTNGSTDPVIIQLYLFADANGNTLFDSGESILPFTLIFQSTIPVNSSIASQEGFYQFQTFPGDGSCLVVNWTADQAFNSASENGGTGAQYLIMYYVTGPDVYQSFDNPDVFANITPVTTTVANSGTAISVDPTGALQPSNTIPNLNNSTNYYFRAAIQDNAGNIGYLTPASDDLAPGLALQGAPIIVGAHGCQPGQIAGLLSKNGNCFISTVAYGSQMAPEVQIFRDFRDRILMKTHQGQKFVRWYYMNGSMYAERIRHHDNIRALVRGGLYPLLGFSWLALKIGATNACLLISTVLLLPLLFYRFVSFRKKEEELYS